MKMYVWLILVVTITVGYPLYELTQLVEARVGQLNDMRQVDYKRD